MENNQHIWATWASKLHRWGMLDFAATLLEAIGPLNLLGAQVVYLGQPFFEQVLPAKHIDALAVMLEDPDQTHAFADFLRTQGQQQTGGNPT